MSKQKKSSKQDKFLATILLLTAIANLIDTLIDIIRKFL